ncbi:MAG: hypothetical protein AVDCRST_MAG88-4354, partial [uncultured Thermomicrobiales bacterium]
AAVRFEVGMARAPVGSTGRSLEEMRSGLAMLARLTADERARLAGEAYLGTAPDEHYYAGLLVLRLGLAGRLRETLALGEPLVSRAAAGDVADSSAGHAYSGLAMAYAGLGRPDEARAASARSRQAYQAAGHFVQVGFVVAREIGAVALPYAADDLPARRRLAVDGERAAAQASDLTNATLVLVLQAELLLLEGRWAEARRRALEARDALSIFRVVRMGVATVLGPLARAQGDGDLARALVREALPEETATALGESPAFMHVPGLHRLAADLALDTGDLPGARAWLDAHDRWLAWADAILGQAEGQLGWAAYYQAAGELPLARRSAGRALAHASAPRQPLALLAVHRLLGELDTVAGRHAAARAHLDAALALADACAAPYERALTLLALAELRAAERRSDEASATLDRARAILEPLGARPALARAAALAADLAGEPVAPAPLPDRLSRREAEVLRLLAAGQSNGQIAQALFLSPRTVQRHVANAYLKIGAHNKAEATAYALRHGLA